MTAKTTIYVTIAMAVVLLASCKKEEFPLNSSSFSHIENNDTTIIYTGSKAGDFTEAAGNIDWTGIRKLVVKGHVNNKDIGGIKRYISEVFNGPLRELDFRDAEIFEGQFINRPFAEMRNLRYFIYPRKMVSTGDYVIDGSLWVKEIIIPEEVEIIGARTFEAVSRRIDAQGVGQVYPIDIPYMPEEKYKIPAMVKKLGDYAYQYYPYDRIEIPESVEVIGQNCFANSKLTSFTFPPKVTEVPDYCFYGNTQLKTVTLHEGITRIGALPFGGTIDELILPDNVTSIGKGFISGMKLKYIKWPKNLRILGEQTMYGSTFEDFTVPEQVVSLGASCFYTATTKILRLHKNIVVLGRGFANGMPNLEELHIAWTTPPADNKLFDDVLISPLGNVINRSPDFDKVKLYVPAGTAEAYRDTEGWKNFKQIIEE